MPRQLPDNWRDEKVPDITPKTDEYITQVREYELITPLFGGGVETQKADPITVVRATEVRGQLRFWWRATRGGQFGDDLAKMKQAEDAVWGSSASFDKNGTLIGGPSQVQVVIECLEKGSSLSNIQDGKGENVHIGAQTSPWNYVTFPLRDKLDISLRTGVKFRLSITIPTHWRKEHQPLFHIDSSPSGEVEAALWAWETFGGLGGRTRRGFGALTCVRIPGGLKRPTAQDLADWFKDQLEKYVIEDSSDVSDVSHLTQNSRIVILDMGKDAAPDTIWIELFTKLRDFRQARAKNKFGRSLWPDADAVRRATSKTPAPKNLPRAAFGLPILFHFMKNELDDVTLQTDEYDRMASPLILRPFRCRDRYVGIGIVLDAPALPPGNLELIATKDRSRPPWSVDGIVLSPTDADAIKTPTGQALIQNATKDDGTIDVLRAFLNYLERK